jgi:hypothetical protein
MAAIIIEAAMITKNELENLPKFMITLLLSYNDYTPDLTAAISRKKTGHPPGFNNDKR